MMISSYGKNTVPNPMALYSQLPYPYFLQSLASKDDTDSDDTIDVPFAMKNKYKKE